MGVKYDYELTKEEKTGGNTVTELFTEHLNRMTQHAHRYAQDQAFQSTGLKPRNVQHLTCVWSCFEYLTVFTFNLNHIN